MSCTTFDELRQHVGHNIVVVLYGNNEEVTVECEDCHEVLFSFFNDICCNCTLFRNCPDATTGSEDCCVRFEPADEDQREGIPEDCKACVYDGTDDCFAVTPEERQACLDSFPNPEE